MTIIHLVCKQYHHRQLQHQLYKINKTHDGNNMIKLPETTAGAPSTATDWRVLNTPVVNPP